MRIDDTFFIIPGIILFIGLFLFFPCFCFWRIGKKVNAQNAWLAWIPFVNFYFVCSLSKITHWRATIALVLIPFGVAMSGRGVTPLSAGILLAGLISFAAMMIKLPTALGIKSWQRVLIIIPWVNYVYLGYLAFRKEPQFIFSDSN